MCNAAYMSCMQVYGEFLFLLLPLIKDNADEEIGTIGVCNVVVSSCFARCC